MKKKSPNQAEAITKGYKVTNSDFTCNGFQYELNKIFEHTGKVKICSSGFHFCQIANDCFNYYSFDSSNRVFEVEAYGKLDGEGDKNCCAKIKFIKELTWSEVLILVNSGKENTGRSNSGNSNSGNWNSGNRNSGDSNSGDRNSGAFCLDENPYLLLFDLPTKIKVKDWENMEACRLMYSIDPTIWVPMSIMTDKEKADNPKYETTEGYLKTISMQEAWANFWGNLHDDKKILFTSLPNFDNNKFEKITGIKINN